MNKYGIDHLGMCMCGLCKADRMKVNTAKKEAVKGIKVLTANPPKPNPPNAVTNDDFRDFGDK